MKRLIWILVLLPFAQATGLADSWLNQFMESEAAIEQGEYTLVIEHFEACLSIVPENPTAAYHLACACSLAGRKEEALYWLERSVEWGWRDAAVMEWDRDLDPIKGEKKFKELVDQVKKMPKSAPQKFDIQYNFQWYPINISKDGSSILMEPCSWDLKTGELRHNFCKNIKGQQVGKHFVISSDYMGKYVAVSDGFHLNLFDLATGVLLKQIDSQPIDYFAFTPDSKYLVAGGKSKTERFLLPECKVTTKYAPSEIGVIINGSGSRVMTITQNTATLWNGDTGDSIVLIADYSQETSKSYRSAAFAPGGGIAYIKWNQNRIDLVNSTNGTVVRSLDFGKEYASPLTCAFLDENTLVILHCDDTVRWWSVNREEPIQEWVLRDEESTDMVHNEAYYGVFSSQSEYLLTVASQSDYFELWDLSSKKMIRRWPGRGGASLQRAFSHAGLIIPLGIMELKLVDPQDGRTLNHFKYQTIGGSFDGIVLKNDNALVSGNNSLRAFDLHTGLLQWSMERPAGRIVDCDFLLDQSLLAMALDNGACSVLDLSKRTEVARFEGTEIKVPWPGDCQNTLRLHPQGDRVAWCHRAATGGENSDAIIYSLAKGEELFRISPYQGVEAVAWNPEGTLLVSGHRDGTARLWDGATGAAAGVTMEHSGPVRAVAFDQNGKRMAAGIDDAVKVWNVSSGDKIIDVDLKLQMEVFYLNFAPNLD